MDFSVSFFALNNMSLNCKNETVLVENVFAEQAVLLATVEEHLEKL